MALNPDEIQALPGTAPAETPAPEPTDESTDDGVELPDEVLMIPAVQGILEGRPAAVYDVTKGSKTPAIEAITKNYQALADAGIGFYQSKDGAISVAYNTQFISPEEIEKADAEDKLTEIAEPIGSVLGAYDAVLNESAATPATDGQVNPATSAAPAPTGAAPAPVERKLTTARLQNIALGSPTSGPAPGAGRVLNNVLKRAV